MTASPELKKLIDELGPIEAELGEIEAKYGLAGKEKRAKALRASLAAEVNAQVLATDQIKLEGTRYAALVSERRAESEIDKPATFKLLGKMAFVKACGFTLTKLKELVKDEAQRDALVKVSPTGPRLVKTYRKAA
jgi:hypothetical protein